MQRFIYNGKSLVESKDYQLIVPQQSVFCLGAYFWAVKEKVS